MNFSQFFVRRPIFAGVLSAIVVYAIAYRFIKNMETKQGKATEPAYSPTGD